MSESASVRTGSWTTLAHRVELLRIATPTVLEVVLAPCGPALSYRSGQYVTLGAPEHGVPERAYSVANAPRPDGRIHLLVTRYARGVTSGWVHHRLKPDDEVTLNGPFGTLVPDGMHTGPVLLLAAGCGAAPIGAIAETLLTEQPDRQVTVLFSARTAAHGLRTTLFDRLARQHPQFRYVRTLTRQPTASRRRRVPAILDRVVGDLTGWEVFAAGPEEFVRASARAVVALGAAAESVHTEEFLADPVPWVV